MAGSGGDGWSALACFTGFLSAPRARQIFRSTAGGAHTRGMPCACLRALCGAALVSLATGFGSPALAGASSPTSVADAQLTGTYSVLFRVVAPAVDRRDRTTLTLGFAPKCDSGACDVTVSTLAESCVSGSCGQPPSDLTFATAPLRFVGSEYKGNFIIKTGCTANGTYFPYAYDQRTLLTIRPTAAQDIGALQVTTFVGTLELLGSPDATGHKWGCTAYRFGLDLAGRSQT